jgi:hypothetical protein
MIYGASMRRIGTFEKLNNAKPVDGRAAEPSDGQNTHAARMDITALRLSSIFRTVFHS